jgi:ubiquitin-conjugating enzyme E2 C
MNDGVLIMAGSASPLNGQAAELWDKDPAEYKRLVLARHRDLTDEELKEQD